MRKNYAHIKQNIHLKDVALHMDSPFPWFSWYVSGEHSMETVCKQETVFAAVPSSLFTSRYIQNNTFICL